jgi:hypothetical protein
VFNNQHRPVGLESVPAVQYHISQRRRLQEVLIDVEFKMADMGRLNWQLHTYIIYIYNIISNISSTTSILCYQIAL